MQRIFLFLLVQITMNIVAQENKFILEVAGEDCIRDFESYISRSEFSTDYSKMYGSSTQKAFYTVKIHASKFHLKYSNLTSNPCIGKLEKVPETILANATTPDDPLFSSQWSLSEIEAELAWSLRNPEDSILIGIVDTGTDFNHPDLQNYFINKNDPVNGIDDDANGFTDDFRGWDFGEEDNDPQINTGFNLDHGMEMTSLAAAPTDDGIGMASAGRTISYLPIKFSDAAGNIENPYEAIAYAIEMGCDIVNCSWTQDASTSYAEFVMDLAIEKDVLIVAAAGNFDNSTLRYPCAFDNVLCVGAIDESRDKSGVSSYGSWIDIASPGSNMWAAKQDSTYFKTGGTSAASAFTSGAAAWLRSIYPTETAGDIKTRILKGSSAHESLVSVGKNQLGQGILNLYGAQVYGEPEFESMVLWPNPSNGTVHIDFRAQKQKKFQLYIYDILGRKLVDQQLDNIQLGDNQLDCNFYFKNGQYILILQAENSRFQTEFVIVN